MTKGAIPYLDEKKKPREGSHEILKDSAVEKFRKANKLDSVLMIGIRGDILEVNNDHIELSVTGHYLRALKEVSRMMEDCVDDPSAVIASAIERMMREAKAKGKKK